MTATLQPGWLISGTTFGAGTTATAANWNAMASAGLGFVLAKAYEVGSTASGTDSHWAFHKKQMERKQGAIQKGAWCWLQNDGAADDQADAFLERIDPTDHDPTGWLCAVRVDGTHGQNNPDPGYTQLHNFSKEFWRQAPGHPLLLLTRKTYWNSKWKDKDAKALGLTLFTIAQSISDPGLGNCLDGSDLGTINLSAFDTSGPKLAFGGGPKTPYSGNYAGFTGTRASTMILWGDMKISGVGTENGVAFNGTVTQLQDLTRPAEPVANNTERPSPLYAQAFVLLPAAVDSLTYTNETPDPVFALAYVAQARGGSLVPQGTMAVTSNQSSMTVSGKP